MRQRMVAAARASMRVPELAAAAARTAVNGLWLGVLDEAELVAIDERFYDDAAAYTTVQWNEQGLFDWERKLVDQHFDGCSRVVVVAAGGGREVLALLELGFDAVGYEPHPRLAEFGQNFLAERGHPDRFQRSERDAFPSGPDSCDAAVVGWGSYSLIHGRDRRVRFMSAARAAVRGGGPILFSYVERQHDDRETRWSAAIASRLRRLRRQPPAELGDTLVPNLTHVFTHAELAAELDAAGLKFGSYWVTGVADDITKHGCAVAHAR